MNINFSTICESLWSLVRTFIFNLDVWINVWANILVLVPGFLLFLFLTTTKRRKLYNFFGLNKNKNLSILLSTLFIPPKAAIAHSGSLMNYTGFAIPEYEYQVIHIFSELFSLVTSGRNLVFSILNKWVLGEVLVDYINAPQKYSDIHFHNFVCVGGPSANSITDYYMKNKKTFLGFNPINAGVEIQKGRSKGKLLGVNSTLEDFGILEKIIDKTNDSVVYIAAGGNYAATKSAAYFLAENWESLYKEFGNKGFAICLKVSQYFVNKESYKYPKVIYKHTKI